MLLVLRLSSRGVRLGLILGGEERVRHRATGDVGKLILVGGGVNVSPFIVGLDIAFPVGVCGTDGGALLRASKCVVLGSIVAADSSLVIRVRDNLI